MAVPLRVLDELADRRLPKSFRLGRNEERQLKKLSQRFGKSESWVVETAITHLWGTVVRGQAVWIDDPTEPMRALEEPQEGPEDAEA